MPSRALGGEHRVQQAWKASVQVVGAQREQALSAVGPRSYQPSFAQDAEVVRQRGLGETEFEHAAGGLVSIGQPANDLESGGVAQSVQDARKFELCA